MRLNCSLISFISAGSWHTTYTRVPHYITNYRRSLVLESLEYAVFDLTLEDSVTIEINSSVMTGRIITGKTATLQNLCTWVPENNKVFISHYHIR